jgi:hypothetical protein
MGNQASRIPEGSPLACLLNIGKALIQKVFNESDSRFTAPRPAYNILWEMGKNCQKEGALIIMPFFS